MLNLTNGDAALPVLRANGIEGDLEPWRDVLHEGPVPALGEAELRALRARFLARDGLVREEEVLAGLAARDERLRAALSEGELLRLWFEADLYDVLQVIQVLARVPDGHPVLLALAGRDRWRSIQEVPAGELAALAAPVDGAQLALARRAWDAFTAPSPEALSGLARGTPELPAVGEAVRRLAEEYPWAGSGMSRTERQLLEAVAEGASTREEAFLASVRCEERPFLGDLSAFDALDRLAPLLDGMTLNDRGRAVLAGEEAFTPPAERWIGGVRLPAGTPPWQWDPRAQKITRRL